MSRIVNIKTSNDVTSIIKEKMVKDKIITIPIEAKGSNVLNAEAFDILKLNTQVFYENKDKSTMSLMMR